MTVQSGVTKGALRRETILRVAAEVFAEKGFQRTTTRKIGDLAGIHSGSIYYYFDSKEAIIRELVGRYWKDLFEEYDDVLRTIKDPQAQFTALVVASLKVSSAHLLQVTILHQEWPSLKVIDPELESRMGRLEDVWVGVIRTGIEQGTFRQDIDPILIYRTIMGAISWVPRWYRERGRYRVEEVAASQAEVVLRGITR